MRTPSIGDAGVPVGCWKSADLRFADQYISRWSSTCGPKSEASPLAWYCACPLEEYSPLSPGGSTEKAVRLEAGGASSVGAAPAGGARTAMSKVAKRSGRARID